MPNIILHDYLLGPWDVVRGYLQEELNQLQQTIQTMNAQVTTQSVVTGCILLTGTAGTPSGYLPCDGSAVSRTAYRALYQAIGVRFGAGDGVSTFTLPSLTAPSGETTYIIKT